MTTPFAPRSPACRIALASSERSNGKGPNLASEAASTKTTAKSSRKEAPSSVFDNRQISNARHAHVFAGAGLPMPMIATATGLSRIHPVGRKNFNAKALSREDAKRNLPLVVRPTKWWVFSMGPNSLPALATVASWRLGVFALNPYCMVPGKSASGFLHRRKSGARVLILPESLLFFKLGSVNK